MYIEPQTNIKLLSGVPLDNTYDHTIMFTELSAQTAYFTSKVKYNLTNYSYQRVQRGVARVGVLADNLYDCNYMMFQNSAYGTKWFYAFITSVEYVNNETSTINFEIDVMQTWLLNHDVDYCFVEREHAVSDNIGEHIEPESVDVGEYVYNNYGKLTSGLDPMAVVIMVSDVDKNIVGTLYEGVYSGAQIYAYNVSDIENIKAKINEYTQSPDSIVSIYMCPVILFGQSIPEGGLTVAYSESTITLTANLAAITSSDTLDGYLPKNNKMYTYPYNFINLSAGSAKGAAYRYEFFDNLTPSFKIDGMVTQPVQVALKPYNYKGSGATCMTGEALILDGYPMCSWNTDAFKAWLAQNSVSVAGTGLAILGNLAMAVVNPVVGAAGAVASVSAASGLLQQGYKASIAADITKGSTNSGNIDFASGYKNFFGGRMSVSHQYAAIIDEYFTRFGYATNRLKIPNRTARPHWNYVKTIGCTLTGSVPADDMRKLCSIYDNGVTFWQNGDEVGQYSLDNSPTT